jgi:anthranilate/para-aminobenzoate synthase component I
MVKDPRCPLIEEIDAGLSPLSVFELFRNRQFSFFLDSGMDPHKLGRYSFIGSDPFLVLSSHGNEVILTEGTMKKSPGFLLPTSTIRWRRSRLLQL